MILEYIHNLSHSYYSRSLFRNHHVEEGKRCVPNKHDYVVTSRDGLNEVSLEDYCRSFPNQVLPAGGSKCVYCPNGVKKRSNKCNDAI